MYRQYDQNQEQQRHEDFSRAFDAFLYAHGDHEMGCEDEQAGVDDRPPGIADKVLEETLVLLGGRETSDTARHRVHHVFGRPSRYYEVEPQDQECGQHAVVTQKTPPWVQRPVGTHGIAVRSTPHGELRDHERQPQQQDAKDVDYQKCPAAVVPGYIGEAPDVTQPHGTSRGDQHSAQFATQGGATLLVMHNLTCLLSQTGVRMHAHTRPISPARRSPSQAFRPAAAPVSIWCILRAAPAGRWRKSPR